MASAGIYSCYPQYECFKAAALLVVLFLHLCCGHIHCCLNLVSWSTSLVQTKIPQQLLHGLTFSTDICGPQRTHSIDYVDTMVFSCSKTSRLTFIVCREMSEWPLDGLPWNLLLLKFLFNDNLCESPDFEWDSSSAQPVNCGLCI